MRLSASKNPKHYSEAEEKLGLLDITDKNNIEDEIWEFSSASGVKSSINLQMFKSNFDSNAYCIKNGIDASKLCRILLIELNTTTSSGGKMIWQRNLIYLLLTFLSENELETLASEHLQSFLEYYLMSRIGNDGVVHNRINPRSSLAKTEITLLLRFNDALRFYGLQSIITNIKLKSMEKSLKNAIHIISAGDLTYAEWLGGGTFNNLTLDYGRYYVEYLDNFYSENYEVACALSEVINNRGELIELSGLTVHKNTTQLFYGILSSIDTAIDPRFKKYNTQKIVHLKELISKQYELTLKRILNRKHLLSSETIERISFALGVRVDTERDTHLAEFDRLRSIVFFYLYDENSKHIERLLQESTFKGSLSKLKASIKTNSLKLDYDIFLPPKEYYENLGIHKDTTNNSKPLPLSLVHKVRASGLTCILSFTGWRSSELGFPTTSINSIENHDIIDQYSTPLRHSIRWNVFKTHGEKLHNREITQGIYELIIKHSLLINPKTNEPALYIAHSHAIEPSSKDASHSAIAHAAGFNWEAFVTTYKPFKILDYFDNYNRLVAKINSNIPLLQDELTLIDKLKKEIDSYQGTSILVDPNIRRAKERFTEELDRVKFHLTRRSIIRKKDWIVRYHEYLNGGIPLNKSDNELFLLFEKHIPLDIRNTIKEENIATLMTKSFTNECSKYIINECLYPTPHAFRHMWAEAVYRRYDGDAGWMIRSNFKHISKAMWISYISDRKNIRVGDTLKSRITSSLLKNWLRNEGTKTTGKYHRFLTKLFRNTATKTMEELNVVIDELAINEVLSIKANPWGYCINMRDTSYLARCAEDGSAAPHNAKPELCLGCISFLFMDSNIDYIILHSWQHIDLLESSKEVDIPMDLIKPSYDYIKLARKRISEVSPTHRIISKYESALKHYDIRVKNGLL